ncbi:MAG: response regulator [Anaerolineae bacterium]|nr:response regulator [Anaerolineae bacterium]
MAGEKIVIVDDEMDTVSILAKFLEMCGFQVIGSLTGMEGMQAIAAHQPKVIILDLMLPDADGYQLCRLIRHQPSSKETPVIMLSARTTRDEVMRGYRVGATSYLKKPVDLNKLLEEVKRLLYTTHVTPPEAEIEQVAARPPSGGRSALIAEKDEKSNKRKPEAVSTLKKSGTVHIPGMYIPREGDDEEVE